MLTACVITRFQSLKKFCDAMQYYDNYPFSEDLTADYITVFAPIDSAEDPLDPFDDRVYSIMLSNFFTKWNLPCQTWVGGLPLSTPTLKPSHFSQKIGALFVNSSVYTNQAKDLIVNTMSLDGNEKYNTKLECAMHPSNQLSRAYHLRFCHVRVNDLHSGRYTIPLKLFRGSDGITRYYR